HIGEANRVKAAVIREFGDADKLRYEEVATPTPAADEVLVKVHAAALNHLDIWVRMGAIPDIPLPHVTGSDVAGVVADVGKLVANVKPGDEVVVNPSMSCGRCYHCLTGNDNLCAEYSILGAKDWGGYAEYVKVPAVNVLPKPRNLDFTQASAVPLVFLTAWHMLIGRAQLKAGETVLVIAAGSGVGSAAIQIAKLLQARVIATAGGEEKLKRARELGADEVINHSTQNIAEEVKRLTNGAGVNVVVDNVGEAVWTQCLSSLARAGRMVFCGATTGKKGEVDLRTAYWDHLSILGSTMGTKGELLTILKFVENGKLKPVVHSVFPLKQAADAHELMENRGQFGKTVLTP
ncbi:MAG: zinc-binding dehydrogenase, partial [Candidatus Bathyarchaeia archaeon]